MRRRQAPKNSAEKIKVYHLTHPENVKSILKRGIIPSYGAEKLFRKGIRRYSVYAYPRKFLDWYSDLYASHEDIWIEIEVNPEKVFVAEMRFEAQEMDKEGEYWKSFMKLSEYLERKLDYVEPEILIPHGASSDMLTGVIFDWKLRPILMEGITFEY